MKKNNFSVKCENCGATINVTCQCTNPSQSTAQPVQPKQSQDPAPLNLKTAAARIEALRAAGVNVDNLFAMQGANGGDFVASNCDGRLTILADNNPIFDMIRTEGDVPNRKLFRRWIMAQLFRMIRAERETNGNTTVTSQIHRLGYEYTWRMLLDELHAQLHMHKNGDTVRFQERNRWFDHNCAICMASGYVNELKKYINRLPRHKCKGIPYVRLGGKNIFVDDLQRKVFQPIHWTYNNIVIADTPQKLFCAVRDFNAVRIALPHNTRQSSAWMEAYKGAGAYFTLQNLIRFHGFVLTDEGCSPLTKEQSLRKLEDKAVTDSAEGVGYRLLAMLKEELLVQNFSVERKMNEWKKK